MTSRQDSILPPIPPPPLILPSSSPSSLPSKNDAAMKARIIEKQRQILSQMIFPSFVPKICHPKVDTMVLLLQQLHPHFISSATNTNTNNNNGTNNDSESFPHSYAVNRNTPSFQKLQHIHQSCHPFITKFQKYQQQISKLEQQIQQQHQKQKQQSQSQQMQIQHQQQIQELSTLAKIQLINYNYCISSKTCPQQMVNLQKCWMTIGKKNIQLLVEANLHDLWICQSYKLNVERCCGGLVQQFVRENS